MNNSKFRRVKFSGRNGRWGENYKMLMQDEMRDFPAKMKRREFLKESGKAVAYLGIIIPIIGASQSCKNSSPSSPEDSEVQFMWRTVEVTYDRGPGPYPNPVSETDPRLFYTLYDADPRSEHLDEMSTDEWIQGGYRQGHKRMEWFKENVYKCTLKNVFVQTEEFKEPHSSYVQDGNLWEGVEAGVETSYTSDGLVIPGAIVVGYCKAGYTMYWRMSAS